MYDMPLGACTYTFEGLFGSYCRVIISLLFAKWVHSVSADIISGSAPYFSCYHLIVFGALFHKNLLTFIQRVMFPVSAQMYIWRNQVYGFHTTFYWSTAMISTASQKIELMYYTLKEWTRQMCTCTPHKFLTPHGKWDHDPYWDHGYSSTVIFLCIHCTSSS